MFSSFRKRFYFYPAMLGLIVISSFFGVFIFTHLEPKHLRISSEILGYISGVIILVLGILLLDKYYLKIRKSKFRKCLELLLVILLIAAIVVYVRDCRLMFSI